MAVVVTKVRFQDHAMVQCFTFQKFLGPDGFCPSEARLAVDEDLVGRMVHENHTADQRGILGQKTVNGSTTATRNWGLKEVNQDMLAGP